MKASESPAKAQGILGEAQEGPGVAPESPAQVQERPTKGQERPSRRGHESPKDPGGPRAGAPQERPGEHLERPTWREGWEGADMPSQISRKLVTN